MDWRNRSVCRSRKVHQRLRQRSVKIALAHTRLDQRGGTELDFYRTAIGLRELGHEVHLFCGEFSIDSPPGTHAHPIPIVRLGRTARLCSFARLAPKIMSSSGCDVMLSFGRMIVQGVIPVSYTHLTLPTICSV